MSQPNNPTIGRKKMKKVCVLLLAAMLSIGMLRMTTHAKEEGKPMTDTRLSVENLKTDNLVVPMGIDSTRPLFSWNVRTVRISSPKLPAFWSKPRMSKHTPKSTTTIVRIGVKPFWRQTATPPNAAHRPHMCSESSSDFSIRRTFPRLPPIW